MQAAQVNVCGDAPELKDFQRTSARVSVMTSGSSKPTLCHGPRVSSAGGLAALLHRRQSFDGVSPSAAADAAVGAHEIRSRDLKINTGWRSASFLA